MGLSGKFEADFVSFYDAVKKAEVHLVSFDTGATKVEKSLNRMVDSFSGRKVIQDAALMTEAIEKIGGVSKLTESELQRVATRAEEAASKMRAMGVEVPPGLQAIANEAKKLDTEGLNLLGTFKQVAGALGIAFGVESIRRGVMAVADFSGELVNLHSQYQIGIEDLQRWRSVAGGAGVALDTVARASQTLGRSLADGSASTSIRLLGLNVQKLLDMEPDKRLRAVAVAFDQIENPADRSRIAVDLMGKSGDEMLRIMNSGLPKMLDNVKNVASAENIRKIDEMANAFTRMKQAALSVAADKAGGLFVGIAEGMETIAKEKALAMKLITESMRGGPGLTGLISGQMANLLDWLAGTADAEKRLADAAFEMARGHEHANVQLKETKSHAELLTERLEQLKADALAPISAENAKMILQFKELGVSTTELAQLFDTNTLAIERLVDAERKSVAAMKAMQEADTAYAKAKLDMWLQITARIKEETDKHKEMISDEITALEILGNKLQEELFGAKPQDFAGELQRNLDLIEKHRGERGNERSDRDFWNLLERERRRQEEDERQRFSGATSTGPANVQPPTSQTWNPQAQQRPGERVTINNNINMNGLLATTDPSGKAALRDAVSEAVMAGLRQSRRLGSS